MMTYDEAGSIVLAAARRDEPNGDLRDHELLAHLRNTVRLENLVDYEDEETEAWRVFLAHHENPSRDDLVELVKLLSSEGVVELTTVQRIWVRRAQQGDFDY